MDEEVSQIAIIKMKINFPCFHLYSNSLWGGGLGVIEFFFLGASMRE
jgi:hypothetical protein